MTIVGYGLLSIAAAIVFAAWLFHRDVVRVYYRPKVDPKRKAEIMAALASGRPLSDLEREWDMMENGMDRGQAIHGFACGCDNAKDKTHDDTVEA